MFRDTLSIAYASVPPQCRYDVHDIGAELMQQYDVADWVRDAVAGPEEVARCVCMWHSVREHYRRYVKSVCVTVVEDDVSKEYIAQSTARSTVVERMNYDQLLKGYQVYAPWQEFSMYELRDGEAIPRKYSRCHGLGSKIDCLNMNLGQWIRSRSEDRAFVQYEFYATGPTMYRGEEESLQRALKAVSGITGVQWSITGFSAVSLGYLDQYVQEIPVSGEDPLSQKHYLLRRSDGRFVYPEDWYQCDEALLQIGDCEYDFNSPRVQLADRVRAKL